MNALAGVARIAELQSEFNVPRLEELPLFSGGLVGYFGYETVQLIEPKLATADKPDDLGTADIELLLSEEVAVLDNLEGRLWLIVHADEATFINIDASLFCIDEQAVRVAANSYQDTVEGISLWSILAIERDLKAVLQRLDAGDGGP